MKEENIFDEMEKAYRKKASGFSDSLQSEIKKVYGPRDIADLEFLRDIGEPGEYPFTRGIHTDMYRGRLWTMRPMVGFGTPEDTLERVKYLAKLGTGGINIIPDGPTLNGIDPDHPLAMGEIGTVGIPLTTLKDMEIFLESIPIEKISTSIVATTCTAPIIFAQFLAVAEKRGLNISKLMGTIQNCPMKDFFCSHQLSSSHMDICLKTCGDIYEYCVRYMPKWNPTNVNVASFTCYGLSAAQDLGIAVALALAVIEEQLSRGLDIDEVAPRIAFFCATDMNILEQVAKFRAARRLWARLMREKYSANDPRSWMFRFGGFTSGFPLYPQEPLNNIIRLTIEAMALVLGGVQSLFVCAYDEPIALPSEESNRLSLRIQQILAYESGIANTVDPLGGSYFIETATNRIEKGAGEFLDTLNTFGGIASDKGSKWLKDELERIFIEYQQRIKSGDLVKVGVNAFTVQGENEVVPVIHKNPPAAAEVQITRLKEIRSKRDGEEVKKDLVKLREAAGKKMNLMPLIIQAVKDYATVGEIFGTIREAYGYPYDPASDVGTLF